MSQMKVMAFIDPDGYMNIIDVSTPEKARTYIRKCLFEIEKNTKYLLKEHEEIINNLGFSEEDVLSLPLSLRENAEYKLRNSRRIIERQKEELEDIKKVEVEINNLEDVDEIFQYLIHKSPFSDYFIMNHRGQFISKVEDPEAEDFNPSIPNFSV